MLPIRVIKRLASGQYDFLFTVEESDSSAWTNLNHVWQSPIGHHLQKRVCGSVGGSGNDDWSRAFSRGLRQQRGGHFKSGGSLPARGSGLVSLPGQGGLPRPVQAMDAYGDS
jgi:hypothetical protein